MGSDTTVTDVVRFVVLYMVLPLSTNAVEVEFSDVRIAPVQSEGTGAGHSALDANDKGQRSRWLVRRVASLTSELR
jgi:hypothetical protein